jgi:uncharacterized protein (DUF58 family)
MPWPFTHRKSAPLAPQATDAAAIVRRARRLRFRVRPEAVAALAGAYLGARPGTGLVFAELKAYEPGDDVRHLDWNVTARQGRPYVRRFIEERLLTVWLVVDVSGSQRFGPEPGRSKADRSAQAAALLAAAAIQGGDRAGLILVSDQIEAELPPGGGPRHLARLLRMLVASPTTSRRTDLLAAVPHLRRGGRRGLVVIFSDFLDHGPTGPWRSVAGRHDLIAFRVVDPREEALPHAGLVDVIDAETGVKGVIDAGSRRVLAAYAKAAEERRAAFRAWCSTVGAAGHELRTSEDPIGPLLRVFRGRATRVSRPGTRPR